MIAGEQEVDTVYTVGSIRQWYCTERFDYLANCKRAYCRVSEQAINMN